MNAQLSQRAGRALSKPTFVALDFATRQQFVSAVEKAKDFNALGTRWKVLLLQAEKEK